MQGLRVLQRSVSVTLCGVGAKRDAPRDDSLSAFATLSFSESYIEFELKDLESRMGNCIDQSINQINRRINKNPAFHWAGWVGMLLPLPEELVSLCHLREERHKSLCKPRSCFWALLSSLNHGFFSHFQPTEWFWGPGQSSVICPASLCPSPSVFSRVAIFSLASPPGGHWHTDFQGCVCGCWQWPRRPQQHSCPCQEER